MDSTSVQQIIILIILLALSAFFSSAETALTTVNRHKMRAIAKDGNIRARLVMGLLDKQDKMLSAILIGNNIVNLSASSLTTTLAIHLSAQLGFDKSSSTFIGIATGILTLLILIFGEIMPKSIAANNSEKISLIYARSISLITTILTPVIFFVNNISSSICHLFKISMTSEQTMTEMELRTIVDVSQEDGVIEKGEKDIINNVVDFGDSIARDIMCPRIDMAFVSVDMTYDEVADIFIEEQYSRLPVYEDSKDEVIGILNLKDLFYYRYQSSRHRNDTFDIREIMREPFFTYEFQKTSVLMEKMREKSVSFAIVLDEYGSTAGLITLEDLIEEIVGDIRDEFDEDEADAIHRLNPGEYEIEGSMKLDDINDILGTDMESEDYDSIGGYIIGLLDHLPQEGETVQTGNYLFSVRKLDNRRIETVYLKIL